MTDSTGPARAAWQFPSVGRWGLSVLPNGWMFVTDFGIKQISADPRQMGANVSLSQDSLPSEAGLLEYIEAQAELVRKHFTAAKIAGPQPAAFPGSEQTCLFMVRQTPEGAPEMIHVQSYVRVGRWVGIITLSTPEAQLKAVRADYEGFMKGLRILPSGSATH